MVQVYVKRGKEKRGKWMSPRQVISIDADTGMLSVRGAAGHSMTMAFEDARSPKRSTEITDMIQLACDQMDDEIEDILSFWPSDDANVLENDNNVDNSDAISSDDDKKSEDPLLVNESIMGDKNEDPVSTPSSPSAQIGRTRQTTALTRVLLNCIDANTTGERVEVFWPAGNAYYPVVASEITTNGKHVIKYDNDDVETLTMSTEIWRYQSGPSALAGQLTALTSIEERVLKELMKVFGKKPFLLQHAHEFEQFPISNAHAAEESEFTKTVHIFKRSSVPQDEKVISSHVLYKVKSMTTGP